MVYIWNSFVVIYRVQEKLRVGRAVTAMCVPCKNKSSLTNETESELLQLFFAALLSVYLSYVGPSMSRTLCALIQTAQAWMFCSHNIIKRSVSFDLVHLSVAKITLSLKWACEREREKDFITVFMHLNNFNLLSYMPLDCIFKFGHFAANRFDSYPGETCYSFSSGSGWFNSHRIGDLAFAQNGNGVVFIPSLRFFGGWNWLVIETVQKHAKNFNQSSCIGLCDE